MRTAERIKKGKQTISGAGHNEAGLFNYDLTKQ
jgi:hypothetical protein